MMNPVRGLVALAVLAAAPLWAHHSAAAEYDASRLRVLTGRIATFAWTNPHVYAYLDVTTSSGAAARWYLEMAGPSGMRRQGWMPDTLKRGDTVTVEAYAAKDSRTAAKTHRVKLPDGRWLFADSSGPEPRPQ